MARYIDADKFIKDLQSEYHGMISDESLKIYKIIHRLDNEPTADVQEVKHGYFVRNERNIPKMKEFHERGYALSMSEKSIFYTCSACGEWISLSQKYCSECGAKMDGRRDT